MASVEEVYSNFIASDEQVRARVIESAKTPEGLAAILTEQGCDATPQEFVAYAKGQASAAGDLCDGELAAVSGGCYVDTGFTSSGTLAYDCHQES